MAWHNKACTIRRWFDPLTIDHHLLPDGEQGGNSPVKADGCREPDGEGADHERERVEHDLLLHIVLFGNRLHLALFRYLLLRLREGELHLEALEEDEERREDVQIGLREVQANEQHADFPREIAEAALAHKVGNEVERAYRRSSALEKRRELMLAWANFLASGSAV